MLGNTLNCKELEVGQNCEIGEADQILVSGDQRHIVDARGGNDETVAGISVWELRETKFVSYRKAEWSFLHLQIFEGAVHPLREIGGDVDLFLLNEQYQFPKAD